MTAPDRLPRRAVVIAGATLLGGCGFQPLYDPERQDSGPAVQAELASIHVGIIGDRPGQLLRQALQAQFGGTSADTAPRYDLAVGYGISGEGIGILNDSDSSRTRLVASASWSLRSQAPGAPLLAQGQARSVDAYNQIDSQYFYGDLSNDASQRHLAEQIAQQIALQLAIFFKQRVRSG